MKDFFISYSKSDLEKAHWISSFLEKNKKTVVSCAWDSQPKANLDRTIKLAKESARRTVILLSSSYLNIECSINEWMKVFDQNNFYDIGLLLPLKVKRCSVDYLLPDHSYIDLVDLDIWEVEYFLTRVINSFYTVLPKKPIFKTRRFLKGLPKFWNVPYVPNSDFQGRESLLAKLRLELISKNTTPRAIMINGLPGIGKSSFVGEYIYRFIENYTGVWWIRANNQTVLEDDLVSLSRILKLNVDLDNSTQTSKQLIQDWLKNSNDWLLVFDDIQNPKVIEQFLEPDHRGHIILTSRNGDCNYGIKVMTLPLLSEDESADLLMRISGDTNKDNAKKIVGIIGGLPLVLEQTGSYIKENDLKINEYLGIVKGYLKNKNWKKMNETNKLFFLMDISIQGLKELSPKAYDLLNLFSFYSSSEFPLKIVYDGKLYLPEDLAATISSYESLLELANILKSQSLIELKEERVSLNKTLQYTIREKLDEKSKKYWNQAALEIMLGSFVFLDDDTSSMYNCFNLLPHAVAVLELAEKEGFVTSSTGELFNKVGEYLNNRYEFKISLSYLEKAFQILEGIYGSNHPKVASVMRNLGDFFLMQGKTMESLEYLDKALKIDLSAYGNKHSDVSSDLNLIGIVYLEKGEYERAFGYFHQNFEINSNLNDPSNPLSGKALNNMGLVMIELKRYGEGLEYLKKALLFYENNYGSEYKVIADILVNMGLVNIRTGDFSEAQKDLERALTMLFDFYGSEDPKIATVLNNFGYLMQKKKNLKKALDYYDQSLIINKSIYGLESLKVARNLTYIGDVLKELKDTFAAKHYYDNALSILIEIQGKESLHAQSIMKRIDTLK